MDSSLWMKQADRHQSQRGISRKPCSTAVWIVAIGAEGIRPLVGMTSHRPNPTLTEALESFYGSHPFQGFAHSLGLPVIKYKSHLTGLAATLGK